MEENKKQKGFTLVEIIVGLSIVSIGVLGVFSMVSRFSDYSKVIRDSFVASYLAQEGVEIVKNIRDSNKLKNDEVNYPWNLGLTQCSNGCEGSYDSNKLDVFFEDGRNLYLSDNGYKYNDGTKTYYRRRITIGAGENDDEMVVRVDVYWEDKSITLISNVYNNGLWNQ